MAKCCGANGCNCAVTAGPGVTVDGDGSPTNPYIVSSAAGEPTALQAADTPTVNATVGGTGTAADPFEVSADVVLDPAPPGGGANLLEAGPDGLYVECSDVRTCFSAGDGAAYDPVTGEISARVSADAGNTVAFGSDGGLFSAGGGGGAPSVVTAGDTPTANNTVTGTGAAGDPYVVTTDVVLDPAPPGGGANLLEAGPDGLYVECADVRTCFSAGDGAAYDPATGEISARVSADAGNAVTIGGDGGLYAPTGGGATVDTACGLTGDGSPATPLAAAVVAWPYACDVDANAGGVYCDSAGALRSEPRGSITYLQDQQILNPADLVVPTPEDTEVATHVLDVPNPDPCRPAFLIMEAEVDADFNLPAGAGAALGIATDEMSYLRNSGATAILDTHIQGTKVVNGGTIPPGGTLTFTLSIRMGRGSGGATYNRVQSFLRAFVIVL
ncbi:hypothetical protein [Streptomyces sp. NBC_00443]|uniref:hypothetical protein n=1 Tax=Streptomyces sp. NBC_00443 TaxID=2975743 RepID=UPI002E1C9C92